MRNFFYLAMIIVLILPANAQEKTNDEKTLFGKSNKTVVSGYGAPDILFTSIKGNEFGVLMGGRGGVILNHSFVIGGGGYGLVTNHLVMYKIGNLGSINARLLLGYGGFYFGYIFASNSIFHLTIGVLIGGGGAGTVRQFKREDDIGDWDDSVVETSGLFVCQPALGGELNMTKFMRIELVAGYRLISGTDLLKVSDTDLSGFYLGLALKFGKF
jgi:hypothetical protein